MTDYELNFSLKIEEMLSGIGDPVYRCLVVEVWETTSSFFLFHTDPLADVRGDQCSLETQLRTTVRSNIRCRSTDPWSCESIPTANQCEEWFSGIRESSDDTCLRLDRLHDKGDYQLSIQCQCPKIGCGVKHSHLQDFLILISNSFHHESDIRKDVHSRQYVWISFAVWIEV